MTKILNHINTYADLTAYNADLNKDFPNISYIQGSDEVKWYKYDPDHIVCVYNVTSTSEATMLLETNSSITYQIIDGVQQQSVQTTYTFDTLGEHIVKYKINNTTTINGSLFRNCTNLTGLTIPYGITYINSSLCFGCTNLTSVKLPDTLIKCNKQTFDRCTSLPVENGVTYADFCATGVANKKLTTYTLKAGTKFLLQTFFQCANLTSFDIPNGVIQIAGAFESCSSLTSVTIPNSVTSIDSSVFQGCISLTSITIPNSVTSIGEYAFFYCNSLTSVTIEAPTPPTLGINAFEDTNDCPIYVPAESVETYKAASGWSSYASRIQAISE